MTLLNREQVHAKSDDLPVDDVAVPEWGDADSKIRVRAIGTGARLQWLLAREKAMKGDPAPDPTSLLVTLSAIDEAGTLMFSVQDCDWLSTANGKVVERIADRVAELSGLTEDDDEDAEGNSEATPSGDSPSDSPETSDGPSPS